MRSDQIDRIDSGRRRVITTAAALSASVAIPFSSQLVNAQQHSKYGILGAQAPELDINFWIDGNGDDATFSIAENKGKWVFLKCFQNWCPGCHSSGFPTLQKFSTEFHGHPKIAIAGIQTVFEGFSTNTGSAVRKNQKRYDLPIIMGHDAGDPDSEDHRPKTMVDYRTGGTPWLVLIDPEGTVVFNDFHVNTEKLIEFIKEQIV